MSRVYVSVALLLVALTSVSCRSVNLTVPWKRNNVSQAPSTALIPPNASAADIIAAVNRQNEQIDSLSAHSASVSMPRTPQLSADIVYHKPNYLHISAKTNITGKEFDMGSNPELFWFWIARDERPGVYYCRHDQYSQTAASSQLPIEPSWVIEALGVKPLDPTLSWLGPRPTSDGLFYELRAQEQTPKGMITRVVYVDRRTATIAAQRIYDSNNYLVVDATTRAVRRDALNGIYAPQKIDIFSPRDNFKLSIDLGTFDLNRISTDTLATWGIPQNLGAPMVNLAGSQ